MGVATSLGFPKWLTEPGTYCWVIAERVGEDPDRMYVSIWSDEHEPEAVREFIQRTVPSLQPTEQMRGDWPVGTSKGVLYTLDWGDFPALRSAMDFYNGVVGREVE